MDDIRTVRELLDLLATADPDTRIAWMHDGPAVCCGVHHHDITLSVDLDAQVYVSRHTVEITLSGGSV